MKSDAIKKEIDYLINMKSHLWTGFLVSSSGTLTLLFNLDSSLKMVFFVSGTVLSIFLFFGYFKKDYQIENLLNRLKEEK
jgi:hypothetical protein